MSQASQANRSSSRNLDEDELVNVSGDLVRFLINKSVTKHPIKRGDILKYLNTLRDGLSRIANEIIIAANRKLIDVYGYKLVEVNSKSQYILVLCEEETRINNEDNHSKQQLLLVPTLAHIFMNGGSVKEDAMWRFLEKAGLMEENEANMKKILTQQFTKELYLNYIKTGELDNPKYYFKWGPRADEEMPKIFLLKKIGEAFNRAPEYWYEQHKEATKLEENSVRINV